MSSVTYPSIAGCRTFFCSEEHTQKIKNKINKEKLVENELNAEKTAGCGQKNELRA